MQSEWVGAISDLVPCPASGIIDWMLSAGNLGGALRRACHTLDLRLLEQDFDRPFTDEAEVLNLNQDNSCFIRKIFLEGNGVPLTFGRVVVPKAVYDNHAEGFRSLGTRLIGEALLYRSPSTVRSAFEFKNIGVFHPLYVYLKQHLPRHYPYPDFFPARRSVFWLEGAEPLLITEIFLSGLIKIHMQKT